MMGINFSTGASVQSMKATAVVSLDGEATGSRTQKMDKDDVLGESDDEAAAPRVRGWTEDMPIRGKFNNSDLPSR